MKTIITEVMLMVLVVLPVEIVYAQGKMTKITLLEIEQGKTAASARVSYEDVFDSLAARLFRIGGFELAGLGALNESVDEKIVDDAVFELLVTDRLDKTLAKLEVMESKDYELAEYCEAAARQGIKYLAAVKITPDRMQSAVSFEIIETSTKELVSTTVFYDVPNDPAGLADELANRISRKLWQVNQDN